MNASHQKSSANIQSSDSTSNKLRDDTVPEVSKFAESEVTFLLAQYSSLREEILKRIEIQHQLILGTLVAVGTILTIGTQAGAASILLVYPFLAMFLSLAWSQNDFRNRQITQYLWQNEILFLSKPSVAWEHSRTSNRLWIFGSRKVFAARGIFVGTQLLAVLLYWLNVNTQNQTVSTSDSIIIVVDIIATVVTVLIIGFPSRNNLPRS